MAINNDGHPLDTAGNVQVDFVWGNFPMQPNDVRPDNAPSDAVSTTQGRLSTTSATSKNLHTVINGGWNAYPAFSGNTTGQFTGTGATSTAVANYTPYVVFPEVRTLTTALAQDAIKDAGVTGTITTTTGSAGGRASISNILRAVTTGLTTITTAAAHGFNVGDVVGISLSTADSGSLNGTWVITNIVDTTNFQFVCTTTTAISTTAETTGDVHIIATRTKPISNVQAVVAGSAVAIPTQTPSINAGTVTLTTSAPHGLVVGQMVAVAGVAPSGYQNATAQVTAVPNAYSFSYVNATTGAITTAGTVTPNAYMVITAPAHGYAKGDVVTTYGTTDSNFTVSAQTIRWIPTYVSSYVNGVAVNTPNPDTFVLDSSISPAVASKADVAGYAVAVSTVASAKAKALTSIGFPDANTIVYGATGHGYSVGDNVHISKITTSGYTTLNNTQAATDAITAVTANSFTIAKSNSLSSTGTITTSSTAAIAAAGTATYQSTKNPGVGTTVSVTGLVQDLPTQTPVLNAPGSLTFTTTQAHGLAVGGYVTIATAVASSAPTTTLYQGTFVVLAVPSTTSFTISKSTFLSAYPVTTAGTVAASDSAGTTAGYGLNVSNATVVTSTSSLFTVATSVTATSNATSGTVTILGILDTTGTSYVAVKTGTVKTQSIAKNAASTAITATPTITVFN